MIYLLGLLVYWLMVLPIALLVGVWVFGKLFEGFVALICYQRPVRYK